MLVGVVPSCMDGRAQRGCLCEPALDRHAMHVRNVTTDRGGHGAGARKLLRPALRSSAALDVRSRGDSGAVKRLHPIHIITLAVASLGAVFAFVAMQVAFDARDGARAAAASPDGDNRYEISQLQTALIRAGVIEDPTVIPDDHGDLDGPWSRCLTSDERDALGPDADDVELPPSCDAVPVTREERCPEPVPASELGDDEAVDEACELAYFVGDQRYNYWEQAHPTDVVAEAEEWLRADGDGGVDRVAQGPDAAFVHVVGEGWLRLYANE